MAVTGPCRETQFETMSNRSGSDGDGSFKEDVDYQLGVLRAKHEAKLLFDQEVHPPSPLPAFRSLAELLAEPDADAEYRIDRLAPAQGRVLLAAQYKAGKSTLVGNLLRSLADGDPFLGRFPVTTQTRRAVLIDDELAENTLRRWFRDQRITNADRVDVVTMRGHLGAFNIFNEDVRAEWAERLRGADYLILDCLRPVLDALGLDENHDAGRFLVAFDALLADSGIGEAVVVHHMGHSGERARGDSRLQDWPDAIWRLVREKDAPDSPVYFTAYGRDVDVPEGRLDFDADTRRLTYTDGTRQARARRANEDEVLNEVIEILVEHLASGEGTELTRNAILKEAKRFGRNARTIDPALRQGVLQCTLTRTPGPRKSHLYALANPCSVCSRPITGLARGSHPDCAQDRRGSAESD
ncbi:ATP-binding protein [Mycobacterium sp. Marseille-P9652]|uniref:ATP-binding protein n=1 Tax=Mycobacterium sp. Marseille-P9652 TaxID=2654950 RepID=UPI0012E70FBD|nr:AAA family ATPase [Mycobacterium sp. Marseille-P9652]